MAHSSELGLIWQVLMPSSKSASGPFSRLDAVMVRKCWPSAV